MNHDTTLASARTVDEILSDMIEPIVGDTPVSVQIAQAINGLANQVDVDALRSDLNTIRKEVEMLIALVGDISVSEQINTALKNTTS